MKFTCDSCNAQYMISDEKVAPNGVKVRCKKCGNVVVVRRPAEIQPAPDPSPAPPQGGLDDELGHAFDNAFGDAEKPAAPEPAPELGSTQLMNEADPAKIAERGQDAAPAANEWYVAIGEAQVGPLPLPEVKRKWEAGDVGPDSLVWRPGMADWLPLSSVPDLATYLSPVPQAPARRPIEAARADVVPARPAPTPVAKPEATWTPMGASALAALASEEIAARSAPEPAAVKPASGGARSIVDGLPDSDGVDPTGSLPLSIKGLEPSMERKIEPRSSVARGAQQIRQKRSATRAIVGLLVTLLLVAGAGATAFYFYVERKFEPQPAVAASPSQPAAAAPAQAAAAAPSASPAPPTLAVAQAQPPVAAEAKPEQKPEAKAEPPPSQVEKEPVRRGDARRAKAEAAAAAAAARKEHAVARAEPAPPPPSPEPKPAAAPKKKDSLLDFDSQGDSALDEALGGGKPSSARSVYVPPKPGGDLPEKLSPSQINEAVLTRVDSLRKCVSEQKDRDPSASGTLKMRWIIQADGGVRDVKCISSEFATTPFAHCIVSVVKSIRFPRSGTKGQEVTFPFSF